MNFSFLTILLTLAAVFAITKCHPSGGFSADDAVFQADDLDAFGRREDRDNDTAKSPNDIRNETLFHDKDEETGGEGGRRRARRVRREISFDNACDGSGDVETDRSSVDGGQTAESEDWSSISRTISALQNTFEQFLSTLMQTSSHYQTYCRILSNGSLHQDTRRSTSTGSQIQDDLDPMCTVNSRLKRAAFLVDSVRNWELQYLNRVVRGDPAVLGAFSALMSGADRSVMVTLCQVQAYISSRGIICTGGGGGGGGADHQSPVDREPVGRIARFRSNCRLLRTASGLVNSCAEIARSHGSIPGAV